MATAAQIQLLQNVGGKVVSQDSVLLGDGITTRTTTVIRTTLYLDLVTNVETSQDVTIIEDNGLNIWTQ